MAFHKILALFGHAETDVKLVQRACELASEQKASLRFLHINESDAGAVGLYGRVTYDHRYSREEIQELIQPYNTGGVPIEVEVVATDDLIETIRKSCTGTDLLIIGHEHQNLMTRWLTDSIDERIINSVPCDVLVVHST